MDVEGPFEGSITTPEEIEADASLLPEGVFTPDTPSPSDEPADIAIETPPETEARTAPVPLKETFHSKVMPPDAEPPRKPATSATGIDGNTATTAENVAKIQLTGGNSAHASSSIVTRGGDAREQSDTQEKKRNERARMATYSFLSLIEAQTKLAAEKKKLQKMKDNYTRDNNVLQEMMRLHEKMAQLQQARTVFEEMRHNSTKATNALNQSFENFGNDFVKDMDAARDVYLEKLKGLQSDISEAKSKYYRLDTAKALREMGYEAESRNAEQEAGTDTSFVFKAEDGKYYTMAYNSHKPSADQEMIYTLERRVPVTESQRIEIDAAVANGAVLISEDEAEKLVTSKIDLNREFSKAQYDIFQKKLEQQHLRDQITALKTQMDAQKAYMKGLQSEIEKLAEKLGKKIDMNNLSAEEKKLAQEIADMKTDLAKQETAIAKQEIFINQQQALVDYMEKNPEFKEKFMSKIGAEKITVSYEQDIASIPGVTDPDFLAYLVSETRKRNFEITDTVPEDIEERINELQKMAAQHNGAGGELQSIGGGDVTEEKSTTKISAASEYDKDESPSPLKTDFSDACGDGYSGACTHGPLNNSAPARDTGYRAIT